MTNGSGDTANLAPEGRQTPGAVRVARPIGRTSVATGWPTGAGAGAYPGDAAAPPGFRAGDGA